MTNMDTQINGRSKLGFVCAVSRTGVLQSCLLASPCLQENRYPLTLYYHSPHAAYAFGRELRLQNVEWLVWVHQDVLLPAGWDESFIDQIDHLRRNHDDLAVVGLYGVVGSGDQARRAGHLLDRGTLLREETPLPVFVDSLDEFLVAVRTDVGLSFDAALGFDFYATDIVLQAQARGYRAAVVDAYCEHYSDTPARGVAAGVVQRVMGSGMVFEQKWRRRLPVTTPCCDIRQPGDVEKQARFYLEDRQG